MKKIFLVAIATILSVSACTRPADELAVSSGTSKPVTAETLFSGILSNGVHSVCDKKTGALVYVGVKGDSISVSAVQGGCTDNSVGLGR